jgi:hypothetical protein
VRVVPAGLVLEQHLRVRHVCAAHTLELVAAVGHHVLAFELVVEPALANGERAGRPGLELLLHPVVEFEEAGARAIARMFQPLGLAGELAQQQADHVIHERGSFRSHLQRCGQHHRRDREQVGLDRFQVLGHGHQPRDGRFLALVERREAAREQQVHRVERALQVERRVLLRDLDLLEVGAQGGNARSQQREVHARLEREFLPGHGRHQPLVKVPQPHRPSLEPLRRVVGHQVVVVVDAGLGRSDRMVLHEEFDELLAERRERADRLDHAAGSPEAVWARGGARRGQETVGIYRLSRPQASWPSQERQTEPAGGVPPPADAAETSCALRLS